MSIALGNNCVLLNAFAETERFEALLVGLYNSLRRVLTLVESWLLLTAQSLISGYEYPSVLVDQALADVHKVPESSA